MSGGGALDLPFAPIATMTATGTAHAGASTSPGTGLHGPSSPAMQGRASISYAAPVSHALSHSPLDAVLAAPVSLALDGGAAIPSGRVSRERSFSIGSASGRVASGDNSPSQPRSASSPHVAVAVGSLGALGLGPPAVSLAGMGTSVGLDAASTSAAASDGAAAAAAAHTLSPALGGYASASAGQDRRRGSGHEGGASTTHAAVGHRVPALSPIKERVPVFGSLAARSSSGGTGTSGGTSGGTERAHGAATAGDDEDAVDDSAASVSLSQSLSHAQSPLSSSPPPVHHRTQSLQMRGEPAASPALHTAAASGVRDRDGQDAGHAGEVPDSMRSLVDAFEAAGADHGAHDAAATRANGLVASASSAASPIRASNESEDGADSGSGGSTEEKDSSGSDSDSGSDMLVPLNSAGSRAQIPSSGAGGGRSGSDFDMEIDPEGDSDLGLGVSSAPAVTAFEAAARIMRRDNFATALLSHGLLDVHMTVSVPLPACACSGARRSRAAGWELASTTGTGGTAGARSAGGGTGFAALPDGEGDIDEADDADAVPPNQQGATLQRLLRRLSKQKRQGRQKAPAGARRTESTPLLAAPAPAPLQSSTVAQADRRADANTAQPSLAAVGPPSRRPSMVAASYGSRRASSSAAGADEAGLELQSTRSSPALAAAYASSGYQAAAMPATHIGSRSSPIASSISAPAQVGASASASLLGSAVSGSSSMPRRSLVAGPLSAPTALSLLAGDRQSLLTRARTATEASLAAGSPGPLSSSTDAASAGTGSSSSPLRAAAASAPQTAVSVSVHGTVEASASGLPVATPRDGTIMHANAGGVLSTSAPMASEPRFWLWRSFRVPLPHSSLLEWSVRELVLRDLWSRDGRLSAAKLRSPAYAGIVRRRLRCAGAIALLLSPLSVLLAALYYGSHALGDVKASGSYLGPRVWTLRALRLFRGYNELPHALQRRLAPSFSLATRFLAASAGVQSPLAPVVARFALVLAGGFLAYLALLGLLDETILTHTTLLGRNLIWYAAIVGAIAGVARTFATDTDAGDGSTAVGTSMSMSQSAIAGAGVGAGSGLSSEHALSRSAAYGKAGAGVVARQAPSASRAGSNSQPHPLSAAIGGSVPVATTAAEDLLRQLALHTHYLPQDWTWGEERRDSASRLQPGLQPTLSSNRAGTTGRPQPHAAQGVFQSVYGSATTGTDYHAVPAPAAPLAALSSAQRRWQTVQRARTALHQLFQFRLLVALGEIAGALLVPLLLLLVLPGRVTDLLRFVATHAVSEPLPRFRSFKGSGPSRDRRKAGSGSALAAAAGAQPGRSRDFAVASDSSPRSAISAETSHSDASRSSLGSARSGNIGGQGALGLGDICCYASLRWRPPAVDFVSGNASSDGAVVIDTRAHEGSGHTDGRATVQPAAAEAAAVSALRKWQRSALAFACEHPSSGATSAVLRSHGTGATSAAMPGRHTSAAMHSAVRRRHKGPAAATEGTGRVSGDSEAQRDHIHENATFARGAPGQIQAAAEAKLAASVLGGWALETAASPTSAGDLPLTNPSVGEVRQWRSIMVDGLQRAAAIPDTTYL